MQFPSIFPYLFLKLKEEHWQKQSWHVVWAGAFGSMKLEILFSSPQQLNIKKDKNPSSSLPHQNYLAMSGADNPPVGRDHLEYLELQRAQAAAIAATADLNMSDMVATAAAASSPNYNSNDFTSTFSALPPRSAMNKLIMNYLVTGETTKP